MSWPCCSTLCGLQSLMNMNSDVSTLRAEQNIMRCAIDTARSTLVKGQTRVVKLPKNRGAMLAGRKVVCNQFFMKALRVSNNMIQSAKFNRGSAATQRRARTGTSSVQKDRVLGFLGQHKHTFSQHMAHKDATYLYLVRKTRRSRLP